MEITSSLGSADRGKIPARSTVSCNERQVITTITYVRSRPLLSPVVTNIGSGLPEVPPWASGVCAGRGLQLIIIAYSTIYIIEALKSNQIFIFKSSVVSFADS